MAVGAQQCEVGEFRLFSSAQRVDRLGVVALDKTGPSLAVDLLEVEAAGVTEQPTVSLSKCGLLAFDEPTVALAGSVQARASDRLSGIVRR